MAKRVRIGRVEENYQQMFLQRLKREGRHDDFKRERSRLWREMSAAGKLDYFRGTWMSTAKKFGFINKADEIEQFEEFMLSGSKTQMQRELEDLQEEIKIEQTVEAMKDLPDGDSMSLPPDIAWVYSHPAMLREEPVSLTKADQRGAPSKGAIGMLQNYANNKKEFYKLVISHLSKKDITAADDGLMQDDFRSVREIESMLNTL